MLPTSDSIDEYILPAASADVATSEPAIVSICCKEVKSKLRSGRLPHLEANRGDPCGCTWCLSRALFRGVKFRASAGQHGATQPVVATRRPPHSTCKTPQSKRELAGGRGYAAMTGGSLNPPIPPAALAVLSSPAASQLPSTPAAQLLTALPFSSAQPVGLEQGLPQTRCGMSHAQASTPAAAGEDNGEGSSARAGAALEELAAGAKRSADAGMAGQVGRVALVSRQESCASVDLADVCCGCISCAGAAKSCRWTGCPA